MKKVIISGGGTGGHVYPAIAIADALKAYNPQTEILFVGAEGRMEMDAVPKAGYTIESLPISGFQRRLTLKNLTFPFKLLRSMMKARQIVRQFNPAISIGVGGYASGPVLRVSNNFNIPTMIQEQNSYPGVTNKLLAKKAKRICVAYEGMDKFFDVEKIRLTGNPVRKDINQLDSKREEAIKFFGLNPDKKTIVIMGGSLGAGTLNLAMDIGCGLIRAAEDTQWIWQCGKYYLDAYRTSSTSELENVRFMPFIDRVDLAYACADLLVCRAGALTISEICIAGKPSILVPSPNVAEDHQTKNAMALVQVGAAKMVTDADAPNSMVQQAIELVRSNEELEALGNNASQMGRPNAAEDIAKEIASLIGLEKNNAPI